MIDLCKLFGVEEGEEFKIEDSEYEKNKYVIDDGKIYYNRLVGEHYWNVSNLKLNEISGVKVIKLPKKKEFTDDELSILRNIDTKYKWLARDEYREILYVYKEKPEKTEDRNWYSEGWCRIGIYNHLFQCIQWEDEEPVFIDAYVERGVE